MFDQTNPSSNDSRASANPRSPGNVSVPLALLLDERLTPLERNAWTVFRARVGEDGTSALPNYEQMRPFLACKAGNQRAAYETASRTVCVLRMTRWVHLAGHRRDPLTGQVLNTLYAVHDTPHSCLEVCASDPEYIELLERSVAHPNHVVRSVAIGVLNELAADGDLPAPLRKRIALARSWSGFGNDDDTSNPPAPPRGKAPSPAVHSDVGSTTSKADSPVRTYRASAQESDPSTSASPRRLPPCLDKMAPDQHRDVQMALQRLPSEHQQDVLDELEARVQLGDRGDHIALKGSWTKGGRERTVPITTTEQRRVLDLAHQLAGAGSLIPAHKSYIGQRRTYDGQCKAAGLSNMHGLRHRYAQDRYEALTGWKAPAAGGPSARTLTPAQRALDAQARQAISRELGHKRTQITAVYLGR